MMLEAAKELAATLHAGTYAVQGCPRLSAVVHEDRIVFIGGDRGGHSVDIGSSSRERVLAHWAGYCKNNGLDIGRVCR